MAASMAGSPLVRMRPTVRAGVAAGVKPGSSSCMPRVTPATVVAIGPIVSRPGASGHTPSSDMRPWVVFRPAMPQQAAGTRTEPPVSEPSATSASPAATAVAEPLEDPPGMSPGSSGFTGVPNHGLEPIGSMASSWRFVLPTNRAPAARRPARQAASAEAASAVRSTARHPAVVGTPSMSMRSFTATRGPSPEVSSFVMNVVMS